MVFRTFFPETGGVVVVGVESAFLLLPSVGILDVDCACVGLGTEPGVGMPFDGVAILPLGIPDCGDAEDVGVELIELVDPFRVFGMGRDGKGPLGGFKDGRGGWVIVAIFLLAVCWDRR